MENEPKIYSCRQLSNVTTRIKDDLSTSNVVLLYAFNRTGKTRLSMDFKDRQKQQNGGAATLYFNAFTEDLFTWDNDLDNDEKRALTINSHSRFVSGLAGLALEEKIHSHLDLFTQIDFRIDYNSWKVIFSRETINPNYNPQNPHNVEPQKIIEENIKISRGEENIFIFALFMAICELALEGHADYQWVKYIYIDDPISSLDENNAITVATDISNMVHHYVDKNEEKKIRFIISSHHSLFYNCVYNEMKRIGLRAYFLHKTQDETYQLQTTSDTPFFHHIEQLCELKKAVEDYCNNEQNNPQVAQSNILKTYHFNMLRAICEKTAIFFGHDHFSYCLQGIENQGVYTRALQIMSHGKYALFSPTGMMKENADLFVTIFRNFVDKYQFELPELFLNA